MKIPIAATPVDDEQNRAYARRLGQDWIEWPAPGLGSMPMHCEHCGGAVLLDPETDQIRQDLARDGLAPIVVCSICVDVV